MLKPFLFCIAVALATAEDVRQGEVARNSTNVDEVFVGGRLRGMSDKMDSDPNVRDLKNCKAVGGLSDPCKQPMFKVTVKNALDSDFIYDTSSGSVTVAVCQGTTKTGLVDKKGKFLDTPIYGYKQVSPDGPYCTWPGKTFEVDSGTPLQVKWENHLPVGDNHIILRRAGGKQDAVDTSLHWAYSLPRYDQRSIPNDGVPIVPHLHGGNTEPQWDGNPEYFFGPGYANPGPHWKIPITDPKYPFQYANDQPSTTSWYHDHVLGITRLNVYAGMAGFYIIRDALDTGLEDNSLTLPAHPYEMALAIQDRMFKSTGELFYPSFPGDPFYQDFITKEGVKGGGNAQRALAEFFGDHMVVNGIIWPKAVVEPRHYRLRFLNGCDSRFLAVYFCDAGPAANHPEDCVERIPFTVVGSDQGLAYEAQQKSLLLMETGSRYDIIFDFSSLSDHRIIMKNIGGDEPFGGDIPGPQVFDRTDRIMAFDVTAPLSSVDDAFDVNSFNMEVGDAYGPGGYYTRVPDPMTGIVPTRRVALFEGRDEFGRLQPLLGTVDPATDENGQWPDDPAHPLYSSYVNAGLAGLPMQGTMAWHEPTTEKPTLDSVEYWEIWNLSADAHPIHLHLVHFEVVGRFAIDLQTDANGDIVEFIEGDPTSCTQGAPTYLVPQPIVQHNGAIGSGYRVCNPTIAMGGLQVDPPQEPDAYFEGAPKDVVTALPGQVTRIKAEFNKEGRYVWHCHILSHEDHEMMRVFEVGQSGPNPAAAAELQADNHQEKKRDEAPR